MDARPADGPYGDGYVHRVFVEVSDDGITASGWATFQGRTLRQAQRAHAPDAWSARIVLTLEAGEQLREIASTADRFLRPQPP
jgi:hypothetical protein